MTIDTILTILGSSVVTGVFGFITGKRKANAETDNQVLQNLELAVNIYKQVIDDLKEEIESLNIKIQELEVKVDELHQENLLLKSKI